MIEDSIKIKDSDATLFFAFDWSEWLPENETIISYTLTTSASGLTITDDYHTSGSVIFLASGGVAGKRYPITCRIETSGSQIDERTLKLDIKNR